MELTITNKDYADIGYIDYSDGDFAFGADENDFELALSASSPVPVYGAVIYSDDGSVGGIVRGKKLKDGDLSITGVTWSGLVGEHVLSPPSGQAYWRQTGDVQTIARNLISRIGLSNIVNVTGDATGIVVTHTFAGSRDANQQEAGRYMSGWAALWQLCYEHGCKPLFEWNPSTHKIDLVIAHSVDHTDDETMQVNAAAPNFEERQFVNHLVCLGQGELASREVAHLYADARGNVSDHQTIYGIDEIAEIYDNSSAEDLSELKRQGTAKLKELILKAQDVSIDAPDGAVYDIGDVVGGTEPRISITVKATVTKKVVKLSGNAVSTEYQSSIRS